MRRRDPVLRDSDADRVLRAPPARALDERGEGERAVRRLEGVDLAAAIRLHRPQVDADVIGEALLDADPGADLHMAAAHVAQVGRAGVVGAVVELGAIGGGLARIGAPRCAGAVPLAQQSNMAGGGELHLALLGGPPWPALGLALDAGAPREPV